MQNTGAIFHTRPAAKSPARRYVSIGFVAAVHIAALWALTHGIGSTIVKAVAPAVDLTVIQPTTKPKPQNVPKPQNPTLAKPSVDSVPPPIIDIRQPAQQPSQVQAALPQAADTAVSSLSSTHTTPPYPVMSRRMGKEGTVRLKLTIGPDGHVTDVTIVRSSGTPELDETAAAWVKAHWRYKPAMQGGMAVSSTTMADVTFNLKNAR